MGMWLVLVVLAWLLLVLGLAVRYRRLILAIWHEPVLKRPVLIIESDDWGAGPLSQADALRDVAALMARFSDQDGRHPVFTLGVVLAIADTQKMAAEKLSAYQRLTLEHSCFDALRQVMMQGVKDGVFSLQLHGMEHYFPEVLMSAARKDERVRAWLCSEGIPQTEELPSPLQSRWLDASVLPSCPLQPNVIKAAVAEELDVFEHVFGQKALVVVPPTFVWTSCVEDAWAARCIKVIVTPGYRNEIRDDSGAPVANKEYLFNGMSVLGRDAVYITRDCYFEPQLGHSANDGVAVVERNINLYRPALLETHRFNFIGEPSKVGASMRELEQLLQKVIALHPNIAFVSTIELAHILVNKDPSWVDTRFAVRIVAFIRRYRANYAAWRHVRLLGASIPLQLIEKQLQRFSV